MFSTRTRQRLLTVISFLTPIALFVLLASWLYEPTTEPSEQTSTTTTLSTPLAVAPDEDEELMARIIAFEQAYFARLPGDTPESYTDRLRSLSGSEMIDSLDTSYFTDTPASPVVSYEAIVTPESVTITFDVETPDRAWVVVSPTIVKKQDGQEVERITSVVHQTVWLFENQDWFAYPAQLR